MNPRAWLVSTARVAAAGLGLWALLALAGMVLRVSPAWPPVIAAFTLALAGELLARLYQYEARAAGGRRARRLVALRLAALALLAWILLEPTLVRTVKREITREVVVLWDDSASMHLQDDGTTGSRAGLAKEAVARSGILAKLGEHLRVRELRFARSPDDGSKQHDGGWNQSTDIAGALDTVLEQVAPDELAGAILVSDGRHNRPSRVEDSARRFGILDAPIGILATGSPAPPRDASVLAVRSPDAIHLGDRMRVAADLKFDGYRGTKAMVRLTRDGNLIEAREITVPQDHHREEVKFLHVPEEGGTSGYQLEIEALEGERFADNNSWSFETSITEARTNVLLIDSFPRWEFRYLRNLFHGRDKSVHLQWVLLHPEQVDGQALAEVAASAARPFGESAATRLPADEKEWRKFDVIILGDLPPETLDAAAWQVISRCVNERGTLLVVVAGPQHMPHALEAPAARDLLPVEMEWGRRTYFGDTGGPFRLALTAEGRRHPVTRHATGGTANDQTWATFPALQWRHPVKGVKDGAEILLTATEDGGEATGVVDDLSLDAALGDLTQRRAREADNALLVTRQAGQGKVACLLTDRTWRLREGAGDVHHHRLWGNLVRWGAGPLLRAGSAKTGLGTDQLTYTADDPVEITARLRDADLNPVADPSLRAEITRDGQAVATVPLAPMAGSNGLHHGQAGRIRVPGIYQVRLTGQRAAELLAADGLACLTANFRVIGARGPVELAETTLDRGLLDDTATASGGKVVGLDKAGDLLPLFLTDKDRREEIRETPLWDNAWILTALALVLTTEWWLRRNGGLP